MPNEQPEKLLTGARAAWHRLPESRASLPDPIAELAQLEEQFMEYLARFAPDYVETNWRAMERLRAMDWTEEEIAAAGFWDGLGQFTSAAAPHLCLLAVLNRFEVEVKARAGMMVDRREIQGGE